MVCTDSIEKVVSLHTGKGKCLYKRRLGEERGGKVMRSIQGGVHAHVTNPLPIHYPLPIHSGGAVQGPGDSAIPESLTHSHSLLVCRTLDKNPRHFDMVMERLFEIGAERSTLSCPLVNASKTGILQVETPGDPAGVKIALETLYDVPGVPRPSVAMHLREKVRGTGPGHRLYGLGRPHYTEAPFCQRVPDLDRHSMTIHISDD